MRRGLIVIAASAVLAGCANGLAQRQAELAHWVGKPESDVVQAMGAPDRSYDAGTVKVLTYEDRHVQYEPGDPYWWGPGPYWHSGFPPALRVYTCDTSFTIADKLVKSFSLRGNGCNF